MPRFVWTRSYLRRHLIKIIIFSGVFALSVVYFQSVIDQNNYSAIGRGQTRRSSSIRDGASQVEDVNRNLQPKAIMEQKRSYVGVDDLIENSIHIPSDDGLQLNKHEDPFLRDGGLISKPDKPVLRDDDDVLIKKDKYQGAPQKFDNLSNKAEDVILNEGEQQRDNFNGHLSNSDKESTGEHANKEQQREPVAENKVREKLADRRESPIRRRKLNDNHHMLKSPDYKKKVPVAQKSAKASSNPDIRVMPKRPSVPEGHSLMVTCADVSVLAHKKSSEEAMYMTFELPETLPRKLKNAAHIIARPGIVTLRFSSIKKAHAGVYKCYAEDRLGNKHSTDVEIQVLDGVADDNDPGGEAMAFERRQRKWERDIAGDAQMNEMKRHLHHEEFAKLRNDREKRWAKMGMMDAYEYDYDRVDGIIEELHDRVGAPPPVNLTSLADRGKFQQRQINQFCEHRGFGDLAYTPPGEEEGSYSFNRHILLNDNARTLFCFVPKVGCTNLKVLFFVVQGFIPLSQMLESRDKVNQKRIEDVQLQESFLNRNSFNREFALRHYFKFMMVRNPLHRLVSGYRSKVQRYPLKGLNDSKPHYNFLRKAIYLQTHPQDYADYLRKRGKAEVNITFSDFIDYWLLQPDNIKFDEHFRSMVKICQPCRARFDFYANFKHFEEDTQILVDKINTRPEFIRAGYYGEGDSTEQLSPSYYAQLTQSQKMSVLKEVELDLDFYYHIFPEERGVHNSILGLDKDVSVPLLS